MKKRVFFSILSATALSAQILPSNILETSSLSIENGGSKSAIDAYSDGGGNLLINDSSSAVKPIDNSPMNELVFKYGESAKSNGVNIVDQVKTVDANSPAYDKALADKINISAAVPKDGTSCDDKNVQTINDVYKNGVCVGNNVEGQSCDDGNLNTQNDIYTNGICAGLIYEFKSTSTNLVNKASFSLVTGKGYDAVQTGAGLFDGIRINDWYSNKVFYWYTGSSASVKVTINEPFRIWRSGTTTWNYDYASIQIFRINADGSQTDVSSSQVATTAITESSWELMTNELQAGTYLFKYKPSVARIDSEWFIEKKVPKI